MSSFGRQAVTVSLERILACLLPLAKQYRIVADTDTLPATNDHELAPI
jgi:hypothetical protein